MNTVKQTDLQNLHYVPLETISKWQNLLKMVSDIINVPAGLIINSCSDCNEILSSKKITEYNIGFPLLWPNGELFGTIGVFDTEDNINLKQIK